jgi:hypothetical protein
MGRRADSEMQNGNLASQHFVRQQADDSLRGVSSTEVAPHTFN